MRSKVVIGLWLLSALTITQAAEPNGDAPAATANTVSWDLSDLYASPVAWQAEYQRVQTATSALAKLRGSLGQSAQKLYAALDAISAVNRAYARLAVYSGRLADEDIRVAANQERDQQTQSLATLINEQTAWVAPEILAIGNQRVQRFMTQLPELRQRFDFFLNNTLRSGPHTLGVEAESVLAASGNVLQQPFNVYSQLANAELPLAEVTLSSGESVQLTQANYEKYRQVANRADRKQVFDAYWGSWQKFEGTLGASLTAQFMGNEFDAKARHFDGALAAALFPDNMPEAVYRRLVSEVNASLPTLHRYLKLRKRILGVSDELQYYDNYPPLFPLKQAIQFDVPTSERITLAALQPLGEDYLHWLRQGFAERWMNVYPSPGKRSGAYMDGAAYDVHPYLLLNHNDDYAALSTFAHEWGHAVHTLLTKQAQPFDKSNYSTFIAESASIGNEMLLSDYMVAHAGNRDEKLYYLGEALEEIRQTYFRQVLLAEFQLAAHEELEQGRPLSGSRLTEMYCGLLRKYYGEAEGVMHIDPKYCIEWAYIPHFYWGFYVYQYATSMAGAAYLTNAIETQGEPARERFLNLLRAGGSDYPYELYKQAGLDMASSTAYQALMARMNRIMDEIESLQNQ